MRRSIQRGVFVSLGVLAGMAACSAPATQSPSPSSSSGAPGGAGMPSGLAGASSAGTAGPSPTAGTTSTAGTSSGGGSAVSGGAPGAGGAACAAGLTRCGAACVDITGSQANCGACGTACPADQSCWQSACICPAGQSTCGANGACIDVQANTANCGKCGTKCATGATCAAGVCACPAGQIACGGTCADGNADESNCGACGKTCSGSTMCLSGACLDPATLSCSGSQQNNSCVKDANITLGQYWVTNNWWGADQGSGQTCIYSNCVTGDIAGWGQTFNWTGTAGAVKTYASIIYGWQWGWKTNSGGQRLVTALPLPLNSNKAVNCGWSFAVTQTGTITMNVAYDLYVHTGSNPGTNDDPTDEIMIWLYRANGAAPIGTKQNGTLSAGGGTFDLYDGNNTRWKVHSYVRQTNATTAVLNMMDFMHDLASRGLVANSKYLSAVQAGSEIFSGQGQVQTNGFYCRVE